MPTVAEKNTEHNVIHILILSLYLLHAREASQPSKVLVSHHIMGKRAAKGSGLVNYMTIDTDCFYRP